MFEFTLTLLFYKKENLEIIKCIKNYNSVQWAGYLIYVHVNVYIYYLL